MHDLSHLAAELVVSVLAMLGQSWVEPPRVVAVEPAYLQQRVCGRACRVRAWYAPDGVVYLDRRLDPVRDIAARSVVVHELVHHVQHTIRGAPAADCLEWAAREREAYAIQARWLRRQGVSPAPRGFRARQIKCVAAGKVNRGRTGTRFP